MNSEKDIREALDAAASFLEKTPMASKRLLFVADSIRSFLNSDKPTLDQAFGLRRGRGEYQRPNDEVHIALVCKALTMQMEGQSFRVISELSGYDQKEFKRLWNRYLPLAVERFVEGKIDPQWDNTKGA